jgi:hypothetical protein
MPHVDILALFWRESEDFELFLLHDVISIIIIIIIINKSAPRATPCSAVRVCAKNLKHVLIPTFNSWPNCRKKFEILAITHETQRPKICRGYCLRSS